MSKVIRCNYLNQTKKLQLIKIAYPPLAIPLVEGVFIPKFHSKKGKKMKTDLNNNRNFLFNWACKGLKYFLLTLFGFAIACVISQVFGAFGIVQMIFVWEWLFRIAVFIFCFFAVAMIYESFL